MKRLRLAQRSIALPDPHDCTDNADVLILLDALFDALVARGSDGQFEPALAKAWSVSEDARTWTFELREGLRFHDGTALAAPEMAASLERLKRPDVGATLGSPAVWGQYLGAAEIEVHGPLTVSVTTPEPMADLLDILVSGYAVPPDIDGLALPDRVVGTGAYQLTTRSDGELRLTANPNWWRGSVDATEVTVALVEDAGERAAAVVEGSADLATRLTGAEPGLGNPQAAIECVRKLDPTAIIYLFNGSRGPCADGRVRRALNLAVDRPAIVDDVLGGAGQPLDGVFSPSHCGFDPAVPAAVRDVAGARQLLEESGFGGGLTLSVDCPTSLPDEAERLTARVSQDLAAVGVELEVHLTEDRVRYAELVRDKAIHDMCLFDSSPLSSFRVCHEKLDSRIRGAWWQGYASPEIEALLDRSRVTVDAGARESVFKQIYAAALADPPWLTVYNHVRTVAAKAGVTIPARSDGLIRLADVSAA